MQRTGRRGVCGLAIATTIVAGFCLGVAAHADEARTRETATRPPADDFGRRLAEAALERTGHAVRYDGRYRAIDYPGGDVPASIGVCSDVVIRSYRRLGIDLQVAVHEDMRSAFEAYPPLWGLTRPDPNIDHRRVPNLQRYFERMGALRPEPRTPEAFAPGDLVSWRLPGNRPHIGIVANERTTDGARPLVVHNVGAGPRLEDVLFAYPITGHYRYHPRAPDASEPATPTVAVERP